MSRILGVLEIVLLLGCIVWVNLWARKERAELTPEERAKEDKETTEDLRIW